MEPKVPELPGKVLDDDQPIVPQRQAQDFTEIHEPIIPSRPRKLPVLVNLDEDRIEENSKDINDYSLVSADSFQPMATQRPVEDITESHEEIIPLRLTKLPELGNTDEDRIELNAKDINDDSFHPIIPTRPSRTSTSTNSSPIPQIPIRPLKKQSPGLTTSAPILDDEKKLNSEKLEGDIEGDGDLTPGNTDTKTTFKTFEEEPASDSSSFNDDVETVQDKEEVEESANDLSEGQHAEIGSSGSQVNEDHTQVCEAGQEEEIPIESIPTVPKRLVKNVETDSIANDSDESKPRAPPRSLKNYHQR